MEYLVIKAKKRGTNEPLGNGFPVFINGERNGSTGNPIKLDPGVVEVAVNYLGSEKKEINLSNTTPKTPMVIELMVGKEPAKA